MCGRGREVGLLEGWPWAGLCGSGLSSSEPRYKPAGDASGDVEPTDEVDAASAPGEASRTAGTTRLRRLMIDFFIVTGL